MEVTRVGVGAAVEVMTAIAAVTEIPQMMIHAEMATSTAVEAACAHDLGHLTDTTVLEVATAVIETSVKAVKEENVIHVVEAEMMNAAEAEARSLFVKEHLLSPRMSVIDVPSSCNNLLLV